MNIQGSNKVNFGWSCETHKKIMEAAIKDLPEFHKYKDLMADYVQRPDHDDIGFLANKHFYFGDKKEKSDTFIKETAENGSVVIEDKVQKEEEKPNAIVRAFSKIFNTDGVSFMDYSGRNNAKCAYEDQIQMMDEAIEDENDELALQNAARACHFLQDVSQPQHIEETSTLGKAWDLKIHTDYETFAEQVSGIFTEGFQPNERKPRRNMQLFHDTFSTTKARGKITRENSNQWAEMTQKQFNTAVQATREFLQNVSVQMGLKNRVDKTETPAETTVSEQNSETV